MAKRMDRLGTRTGSLTSGIAYFLGVTALAGNVAAEPWQYGIALDIGAVRSDNIRLANEGLEDSETVYVVSPLFTFSKQSERANALISYAPQALFYQDTEDSDQIYHVLDAALNTVLVRDRLFVDFSAVNFQTIEGAENRFALNNVPISGQRTDMAIWSVTPRWQQPLGSAQFIAEGTFRQTLYDRSDLFDSDEKSGILDLNNLNQLQGISWALRYQYTRLDYDTPALPWEYQRAWAELGYWLGSSLRVFASGGVETPYDEFLGSDMEDEFWEAGFAFSPSERLQLEFAAGERSFGTSFRGRLAYALRRGRTELTYTEGPSTQNKASSGRRPIQQTDNLDDFLTLANNNQFVRKRAQWINAIDLNKTSITLRLFHEEREDTFSLDGTPQGDAAFRGAALRVDWDVGVKLSLGLTGDIVDREGDNVDDEQLMRLGVDASYRISRRFTLTARAQRTEQEAQFPGLDNYIENQYHLFLRTEIL